MRHHRPRVGVSRIRSRWQPTAPGGFRAGCSRDAYGRDGYGDGPGWPEAGDRAV